MTVTLTKAQAEQHLSKIALGSLTDLERLMRALVQGHFAGEMIPDDTIDSQHYVAGSIDPEHLAEEAVTGDKIADAAGVLRHVQASATLAEINAGKVLVPATAGKTLQFTNVFALVDGTFADGTAVVLEATDGTDIVSIAVSALGDGAFLFPFSTGVTRVAAGWAATLPAGEGIQVVKTGSDFTGGTSITFFLQYAIVA